MKAIRILSLLSFLLFPTEAWLSKTYYKPNKLESLAAGSQDIFLVSFVKKEKRKVIIEARSYDLEFIQYKIIEILFPKKETEIISLNPSSITSKPKIEIKPDSLIWVFDNIEFKKQTLAYRYTETGVMKSPQFDVIDPDLLVKKDSKKLIIFTFNFKEEFGGFPNEYGEGGISSTKLEALKKLILLR